MHNRMLAARTTSNQSMATIENKNNDDDDNDDDDSDDTRDRRWPPVPFISQLITDPTISYHRRDVAAHAGDGVVVVICSGNRFRQNVSHPQHPSGRYSVVSSASAALCWVLVRVLGGVGGVCVTVIRGGDTMTSCVVQRDRPTSPW